MSKSLFKSALLGGIIVFLWGLFSWMVLPWHCCYFHPFENESKVASVIQDNAKEQGMYVIPYTMDYDENTPTKKMKESIERYETGPFVFAAIVPGGIGRMGPSHMVISFLIQFVGALILSWMIFQTKGLKKREKILFGALFGLAVGVLGILPSWNWLGFPLGYVLILMADLVIGWTLASYAMARLGAKK